MKKLLIVTAVPNALRAFLLPFADRFRAQGWRVDAMAHGVSACTECAKVFDRVWDVKFSRSPYHPRNLLVAPSKIREIVVREGYDIVHVHIAVAGFVTRYALKDLKKCQKPKIIYTAHGFNFYNGENPLKNAIFLTLEKLAGRWTDYIVTINREDEAAAKRYGLLPAKKVRYMPGIGVDLQQYNLNAISDAVVVQTLKELGLAPETPLFLSIAEFIPRKRHRDVLRAFAKIDRPKVHLAFAGCGPLMPEIQQLAAALGVANRVHFLGFRRDIPTLIKASVATVLASEQEGLPRSVMESLCLEVPVIGTEIRGIQDLLEGDCGLLVELGNVEELSQAMTWILDHPIAAKAMGKRGRELMANYDLQQILNLHEALYAEALEQVKQMVSV
ncbi:glycosyltransferase family 4 protein [Phormidium sp. LEGE 05292]|uniref:glycosyltransferase family 4 protein n=1 Tax=[Phormidium] sp. LEGE 05292 TaxID=767427 RepID=UPI00187F7373|nr:glycosyltransferase family 4 protein [Phormidium sp. LEGE 05292]MBE9223912.1 glycosyltransferase family 4 protein [Phormidium sp. LEGE 05292]